MKRLPPQPPCSREQQLRFAILRKRGHWVRLATRRAEGRGLPAYPDFILSSFVIRLEILIGDGPILNRGSCNRAVERFQAECLREKYPRKALIRDCPSPHAPANDGKITVPRRHLAGRHIRVGTIGLNFREIWPKASP